MRLPSNPHLPTDVPALVRQLTRLYGDIAQQVDGVSEGRIASVTNAGTAAPTTGVWQQGDFIRNSEPVEAGSAGSMYVVQGWVCVASGEPGTWKDSRCLTGN